MVCVSVAQTFVDVPSMYRLCLCYTDVLHRVYLSIFVYVSLSRAPSFTQSRTRVRSLSLSLVSLRPYMCPLHMCPLHIPWDVSGTHSHTPACMYMTHSSVCRDTFFIHMCGVIHPYVWWNSSICVVKFIHMCGEIHPYVWCNSSICVV